VVVPEESSAPSGLDPAAWAAMLRRKAAVRTEMIARIKSLPTATRSAAAERVAVSLSEFLRPRALSGSLVAVYASTATELDSAPAARLLGERYRLAFPRVAGPSLTFHRTDWDRLTAHQSRVREPADSDPVVTPDVVVVPARAYDREGIRLGHGYGYYDHALAELPATTLLIGLCHDFQIVDVLPRAPHDRGVQWLISDGDVPYRCRPASDSDTMSS
jgi:5-formyltetrahydrofolate cyclo-ligase